MFEHSNLLVYIQFIIVAISAMINVKNKGETMKIFNLMMGAFLAVGSSSIGAAPISQLGSPEGELNIVAWAGYIERGETNEVFDWVTSYEKSTGCNVNVKTAGGELAFLLSLVENRC